MASVLKEERPISQSTALPAEGAASGSVTEILSRLESIILGKQRQLRLALTCLVAGGHLLVEDKPGMGKTVLSHTLARCLGLDFHRVQFTSDLLPADILGTSIFERDSGSFTFHPGPVFTQVLLADEINRATPKTQSALLEVMEERQVTADGVTRPLPDPFFVIATQNPVDQYGTFPLPESQLDRFLMRLSMGYPDREAELSLLSERDRRSLLLDLTPVEDAGALQELQAAVDEVHVSEAVLDYIHAILSHSRASGAYLDGLSPRAGLALLSAARGWAVVHGARNLLPAHVQAVLPAVAAHRLRTREGEPVHESDIGPGLIDIVPIP